MAVTTGLSAFSLYSPGLSQDAPRFAGDRVGYSNIQARSDSNTSSSRSLYYPQSQQQQETWSAPGQHSPHTIHASGQRSVSSSSASYPSYRTGDTSLSQHSAPASPSAYSPSFGNSAAAEPTDSSTPLSHQQALGQMSVSLNPPVPFGGHTSMVHDSLAHPHASEHNHSPIGQGGHLRPLTHQWNSSGSVYPETGNYSHHTTPSPTTHENHFTHRNPSSFQSTMAEANTSGTNEGDLGGFGDLSGQHQHQQPQQHQHPQHHQHHQQHPQHPQHSQHQQHQQLHSLSGAPMQGSLLSPINEGAPHLGGLLRQGSGGSSGDSSVMAYSDQSSVNTTAESAYLPKLSMPMASQPQYQAYPHTDYHRQQHGVSADPSLRLVPPPLVAQAGLPGMPHPMGYPAGPGSDRAYTYHQPTSGSISGPVMSNIGNPGGHMTIVSSVGMPYGAGTSRKPLLYSNTHHPMHHHLGGSPLAHHPGLGKGPQSTHERPFRCDQCPQSFNRNHDLKRHKRIHLAVKPFPCNYCDKSFSRKDALKRHRLVKGCGDKLQNEAESSVGGRSHDGNDLNDRLSEQR